MCQILSDEKEKCEGLCEIMTIYARPLIREVHPLRSPTPTPQRAGRGSAEERRGSGGGCTIEERGGRASGARRTEPMCRPRRAGEI